MHLFLRNFLHLISSGRIRCRGGLGASSTRKAITAATIPRNQAANLNDGDVDYVDLLKETIIEDDGVELTLV